MRLGADGNLSPTNSATAKIFNPIATLLDCNKPNGDFERFFEWSWLNIWLAIQGAEKVRMPAKIPRLSACQQGVDSINFILILKVIFIPDKKLQ